MEPRLNVHSELSDGYNCFKKSSYTTVVNNY